MTDLTEQWKKGELDIDECYFAETEGGIYKTTGEYLNNSSCIHGFDITAILDKVPSYEEWEQLENWARFTDDYHALREQKEIAEYENAELKDTIEALESELKEVCDVLIRKCPEMKEWVMLNWRKLYDERI